MFDAACERPEALLAPMKLEISGSSGPGDVPHEFRAPGAVGRRRGPHVPATTSPGCGSSSRGWPPVSRTPSSASGRPCRRAARLRRHGGHRPGPALPGGGLRLTDCGRATQQPVRGHRPAAAGHGGFRSPDPGRAGRTVAGGARQRRRIRRHPGARARRRPGLYGLKQLFSEALRSGQVQVGLDILSSSANLRRSFQVATDPGDVPPPVRLTEGTRTPRVFCVATPVAMGGPYQYARRPRTSAAGGIVGPVAARFPGRAAAAWPVPRSTRSQKACGGLPVANRSRCSATGRPASWRMPPPPGWNGRDIRQRR